MERLDKVISSQTDLSRKDVKRLVKEKRVKVNDEYVKNSDIKVNPENDKIVVDGEELLYKKYVYYILNKPEGYVSSTEDKDPTVIELLPVEVQQRDIFPAGRLDKNTTGLMILTDDGEFAHDILSPKKHVKKVYEVEIDREITDEMISLFETGVELSDGISKPAKLEKLTERTGKVTLIEGRYHQIKRMFGFFHAEVLQLNRIQFGNLIIPDNLKRGESRELTSEELTKITENRSITGIK